MDYFEDKELLRLLGEIGHDVEGYNFTDRCNRSSYEKGRWDNVLVGRKANLNKDIEQLVNYIKTNY